MLRSQRFLAAIGLLFAFGLPACALTESRLRTDLSEVNAAVILAATPWLVLGWVWLVERRSPRSIGLGEFSRSTLGFALVGVFANVAISAAVSGINARLG